MSNSHSIKQLGKSLKKRGILLNQGNLLDQNSASATFILKIRLFPN